MYALLLEAPSRLVYTEVPRPEPQEGEVLVAVRACGICGSDVHGLDGRSGRRRPPLIMGHEAAGTIERLGPGVTALKEGSRVTFDSTLWCGRCSFCRSGRINLCENRRVLGVSTDRYKCNGAFAQYVVVPQHVVYPLPEELSFEEGALIEPLSVAFHAVHRMPVDLNDTAVVVGGGVIGLLILKLLKLRGCRRVFVLEKEASRRSIAERFGASAAFPPGEMKPLLDRIGGGADIVFEAVGKAETVQTALSCVRTGGRCVLVGNLDPSVPFPLQKVVTGELVLSGTCASSGEYPRCLDLAAQRTVDLGELISARAPLSEGALWFGKLLKGDPELLKVVLIP